MNLTWSMRWIRKNTPPHEFQVYVRAENATYDDMDKEPADALRQALFDEQFGVCAYCQKKIKINKTKIEHHCERSICNGENGTIDRRLDYTNLLLVCLGKGGEDNELHCDTCKATFDTNSGLPMQINPIINSHIATISYSSTGLLRSSKELFDTEINKILNLNAKYLKKRREQKWLRIFRDSRNKNGTINKGRMRKMLEKDLAKKDGHFTNDFPAMSEYMKTKFC